MLYVIFANFLFQLELHQRNREKFTQ